MLLKNKKVLILSAVVLVAAGATTITHNHIRHQKPEKVAATKAPRACLILPQSDAERLLKSKVNRVSSIHTDRGVEESDCQSLTGYVPDIVVSLRQGSTAAARTQLYNGFHEPQPYEVPYSLEDLQGYSVVSSGASPTLMFWVKNSWLTVSADTPDRARAAAVIAIHNL